MPSEQKIAILGAGNIGLSIARGLVASRNFSANQIILTRRKIQHLEPLKKEGFIILSDNQKATKESDILLLCVEPQQIKSLLLEIRDNLNPQKHLLISIVSGVSIDEILRLCDKKMSVVRAMPNTAISIRESMTCLASNDSDGGSLPAAEKIFDSLGATLIIEEEQMVPATALCACGIAFFLRAIRAASQGGIEIGFASDVALEIAAQTAKGAAALLQSSKLHPEREIDKVTTPRGCTIAGLNRMEHEGFSSAIIKGIVTSCEKASQLYTKNDSKS